MGKQHKKDIGAIWHKRYVTFRVWAPFAQAVSVTGMFNNWGKTPLESEGDGYWSGQVKEAEAGQEYKFVIKHGDQELWKNDPRALQLTTAGGNSVITKPVFEWQVDNFKAQPQDACVLYELHIGTFHRPDPAMPGTFETAIGKLDYLAALGVNMIELMPVHTMLMDRGWGYAPDYIYAVESLYGGHYGLMQFVDEAHKRGIGVILDVVYNHFGPDDKLDLWRFDGWSENDRGGIYFYNDWRADTPWGATRPDFGRDEVRQYLLDNVRMWLQNFRLDGLRVDSTIYIRNAHGYNDNPGNDLPDGWYFLQALTTEAKKINPSALTFAEDCGANDYLTKPVGIGGAGFDSQWDIRFPFALRDVLVSLEDRYRNLTGLCSALTHQYNGNPGQRVIYSDSHDSAANGGKRLASDISFDAPTGVYVQRRSIQAAAIVLTSPGIPMLLQGQEFLTSGAFNDWQSLDWEQAEKFKGIVQAHQHLISLRKNKYGNSAGLKGSSINIIHMNDSAKLLAYHRWDKGGPSDDVMVIFNFANQTREGYALGFPHDGIWRVRFNSDWKGYSQDFSETPISEVQVAGNNGKVDIGPYSVLILSQDT